MAGHVQLNGKWHPLEALAAYDARHLPDASQQVPQLRLGCAGHGSFFAALAFCDMVFMVFLVAMSACPG